VGEYFVLQKVHHKNQINRMEDFFHVSYFGYLERPGPSFDESDACVAWEDPRIFKSRSVGFEFCT
jgi:hypothetical protein